VIYIPTAQTGAVVLYFTSSPFCLSTVLLSSGKNVKSILLLLLNRDYSAEWCQQNRFYIFN